MNCTVCRSIWLRPAEPQWTAEGTHQWARRFACGGCGSIFVVRMTKIGEGETDKELSDAKRNPPPKVMLAASAPTPPGAKP